MEQQQSRTHAELDQCRLLTRQLETRVEAAAADCRNLELSAKDGREAVLKAEQHAAEQAQRHEAASSQLKQALAETASSHAAEIVMLETRVSGTCAPPNMTDECERCMLMQDRATSASGLRVHLLDRCTNGAADAYQGAMLCRCVQCTGAG